MDLCVCSHISRPEPLVLFRSEEKCNIFTLCECSEVGRKIWSCCKCAVVDCPEKNHVDFTTWIDDLRAELVPEEDHHLIDSTMWCEAHIPQGWHMHHVECPFRVDPFDADPFGADPIRDFVCRPHPRLFLRPHPRFLCRPLRCRPLAHVFAALFCVSIF